MTSLLLAELAQRCGLRHDAARATAEGIREGLLLRLRLESTTGSRGVFRVRAEAELPRPTDLRLWLVRRAERGAAAPHHLERPRVPTGDVDLDEWLELRGDVEPARVIAWLAPSVRARLRELDGDDELAVDRSSVGILLSEGRSAAEQEAAIGRLLAAARALDDARAGVPVAADLRRALVHFEQLGAELGLELSTCPLAVEGTVDGCRVFVHVPSWGPFDNGVVLVDVTRPGPPGDARAVPSDGANDRALRWLRRAIRFAVRVLGGRPSPLDALLGKLRTPGPFGLPPGFVLTSARERRVVAAARMREREPLDLAAAVRALVRLIMGRAAEGPATLASPYR